MLENAFLTIKNNSKTITAELHFPEGDANGVILAQDRRFGGWSLCMKDGNPLACAETVLPNGSIRCTMLARRQIRVERIDFMKIWMFLGVVLASATAHADVRLESDALVVLVDDAGHVASLMDKANRVEYAAPGQKSPLIQVYRNGAFHSPQSASWNGQSEQLTLRYSNAQVVLATAFKGTHITLEIIEATPLDDMERVQWGPIATSIKKHVGEVVGVVRGDQFAVGLQGLNVKTLGGLADNKEGRDVSRGRAAMPTSWGSTTLRLFDAKGRQVKKHSLSAAPPSISRGKHDICFPATWTANRHLS